MTRCSRSSTFCDRLRIFCHRSRRPDPAPTVSHRPTSDAATRPATTTFFGDTGLWFVPTGEVLANGNGPRAVIAAARTGSRATPTSPTSPAPSRSASRTARRSSARSSSTRASTATSGRSSSPTRPSAASSIAIRGSTSTGPATTSATSTSARRSTSCPSRGRTRRRSRVRGMIKLPTGERRRRQRHRQDRLLASICIVSKEAAKLVEVSGFGGYEWRGSPDGFDTPSGAFRWGAGVGVPVAQLAAGHRRVERLRAVRRHGDDDDAR